MNKKVKRIGATVFAIVIGVVLILFFAQLGESTKGPLEDFMVKVSSLIDRWDINM